MEENIDGGAKTCAQRCNENPKCYHWTYDCKNLECHWYGQDGYAEDDSKQFGRDYVFLGDSTNAGAARRMSSTGGKSGDL